MNYYQRAFGVTILHLGSEHPLSQTFERSLIEARRNLDNMAIKKTSPRKINFNISLK